MPAKISPSSAPLTAPPAPLSRWLVAAVALVLAAATVAAYAQVRHADFFNYDDWNYVAHNPALSHGLTPASALWAFAATDPATGRLGLNFAEGNWHPLTWLSHELDVTLFGLRPGPHHLVSLGFHTLNAVLLLLLLIRLTGALWKSFFVAALFALHPLHVESVAWIAERKDLLSTLFFLLTIWAWVSWTRHRRPWRYLLVLFLYALGLMSKPMLVTLPFVLLLLDFWPLGRMGLAASPLSLGRGWHEVPGEGLRPETSIRTNKIGTVPILSAPQSALHDSAVPCSIFDIRRFFSLLPEKLPLFALALASSIITWQAQNSAGFVASLETIPWSARGLNALDACFVYLRQTFWPRDLLVYYPYRLDLPALELLIAAALLLALTLLALRFRRRRPWLLVGWLWYLGLLVPVIGLVQVGNQAHADRYTYLPLVGLFIILAWTAGEICYPSPACPEQCRRVGEGGRFSGRVRGFALGAAALLILFACGLLTSAQVAVWHDSFTLYRHALAIEPRNAVVEDFLAGALAARGDVEESIPHLRRACQIDPLFLPAFIRLGIALNLCGHTDEALAAYRQALDLDPNSALAREGFNLASAEKVRQAAVAAQPHGQPESPDTCISRGAALFQSGHFADAAACFNRAIELDPNRADAHNNLAAALGELGQTNEAMQQWRLCLTINPNQADALDNLAWRLATLPDDKLRNGPEAVRLAEQAVKLTARHNPNFLETLAAAYAETARFPDAISAAREAAALAAASNRPDLARSINNRLQLYQSNRPCREAPPQPAPPETRVVP